MLSFRDLPVRLCDGQPRREVLRLGGLSLLGLSLPQLARAAEAAPVPAGSSTFGRAKNVIFLYLAGGPPQHETFDPKPHAPLDIRGEFQPISTNIPGMQFCELLPRTSRVADKLAIVRSLATDDNVHSSSGAWVLSGHKYSGRNARKIHPADWPYFGSVVKMLKPSEALPQLSTVWIPDWMRLNENVKPAGQTGGLLGRDWDPERFVGDPSRPEYRVEGLHVDADILHRLRTRHALLEQLDQRAAVADFRGFDRYQQQAFDVLTSGKAVDAFRLEKESATLRETYGQNQWGQCLVLARRLVEAGVRLVHVQWPRMPGDNAVDNPLWDTHARNFDRLEDVLCPVFDVGFSGLINDLDQRGLLDETLVVAVGEFGRTPKINGNAGRDHWGNVFSCALAGAGISGGQTFGASDNQGAYPIQDRVTPGDLVATIYHLLGIDHRQLIYAADGRAIPVTHGEPIHALLGSSAATTERIEAGGDPARVPPYRDRLLTYSTFDSARAIRTFDGAARPKGWRASPLLAPDEPGFGLRFATAEDDDGASATGARATGAVLAGVVGNAAQPSVIRQGERILLTQEVRSPFAGTFLLTALAEGMAESAEHFNDVFRQHFTCRLMLIQFTVGSKRPDHHKVLATADFEPEFEGARSADDERSGARKRFELEKTFSPAIPGSNISFGLGLGVAVAVEKTSNGELTLPASLQPGFIGIRLSRIDLEFRGKDRIDDVQV